MYVVQDQILIQNYENLTEYNKGDTMPQNYEERFDWPAMPDELEQKLLKYITEEVDVYADNVHYRTSRGNPEDIRFFWYEPPEYLQEWVDENIPLGPEYRTIVQVWRNFDYGNRHRDGLRDHSFNYVLAPHPGITRWFDEDDDDTLIEQVHYLPKKWYKHYGSKWHDVLHVNNFRPAVAMFIDRTEEGLINQ